MQTYQFSIIGAFHYTIFYEAFKYKKDNEEDSRYLIDVEVKLKNFADERIKKWYQFMESLTTDRDDDDTLPG